MEGHLYQVNCDCFPRYQYTLKRKQDILFRNEDLLREHKLGTVTENKNKEGAFVYICICKSSENVDFPSTIENIVLRNAEVIDLGIKDLRAFADERQFQHQLVFSVVNGKTSREMLAKLGYIIRIANDQKEAEYIKTKNDNKVEICAEGDVGQTICNILERNALNTLRFICESLDKRTSGLQASTDTIYKRSNSELVADRPKKTKRPGSHDEGIIRSGVLDDATNSVSIKDEREHIDRLIAEIVGMFNRSNIPKSQHPVLKKSFRDDIPDKLLQELKQLIPQIKNCGFRFGTLQIYLDTDCEEMEENLYSKIKNTLNQEDITRFSFVSSQINKFCICRAGSNISVKTEGNEWLNGTLGGFVETSSDESKQKFALMSRHLAEASTDGKAYITTKSDTLVSTIMKENNVEQREQYYIDIAVTAIGKDDEEKVDDLYITEQGQDVPGKLCEYGTDKLLGLPVHISGASTQTGLGIVTVPKLGDNYMVVENRYKGENTQFCKEGDSGAIVCTDSLDNYGKEVQLISMVMGGNLGRGQEGSFTTVKLDKGLKALDKLTGKKFSMC